MIGTEPIVKAFEIYVLPVLIYVVGIATGVGIGWGIWA